MLIAFLINRTAKEWNRLTETIVSAVKIDTFKSRLGGLLKLSNMLRHTPPPLYWRNDLMGFVNCHIDIDRYRFIV